MGRSSLLAAALAGALTLAGAGAALAAPAAPATLPSNCTQAARTVTCTYASTGAEQTLTVPAGVTTLQVTAVGGAGGSPGDVPGGQGAVAAGTLSGLSAGSPLYVEVGGNGEDGGFNGGEGAGGGGASDVRTVARGAAASLDSRLVVAGGGGGATSPSFGGRPGGAAGVDGQPADLGGKAGGAQAGGAGGTGLYPGSAGTAGQGGGGGVYGSTGTGGGGGGGLFGGGGGGTDYNSSGSGGGGSSLVPSGGTVGLSSAAPSITISYTTPTTAGTIAATSGSGQSAQTGQPFPAPLVATVTDPTDNTPVTAAAVTFTVTSGSVSFGGARTATVATGANGQATSPTLTAGTTPGPVTVTATTPGVTTPASFTETVTAAPVPTAVNVKGSGTLSAGGQNYSIAVDTKATATGAASGRFAFSGGGADTTASSRTITSVRKTATGGTVTGTAVTASGKQVPFTLTVIDRAGGRDQVTVQLGSRTVTGTLTNGNITTN